MPALLAWIRAPGRGLALLVLALAAATYYADPYLVRELRVSGLDAMQRLWPQVLDVPHAIIVDIDDESLRRYGQWPWPRVLVARLIDRIADAKPGILGIDMFFPEPDRLSPPQIPKLIPDLPESVIAALSNLPSSEERLARAIARVPTVLAVASGDQNPASSASTGLHGAAPIVGDDPRPFLFTRPSMVRSLPEIVKAARSEASIGVEFDDDGVVRSVPLLSMVQGQLVPAFAIELLRQAARAPSIEVKTGRAGIASVGFGDFSIPTGAQGQAYLHFETPLRRYVSAANLLDPTLDPSFDPRTMLERHIVLLGSSGTGLLDQPLTPLGRELGTEIHAQLIESIMLNSLLLRPPGAAWIELALILVPGLLVIGALRYQRPWAASAGMFAIALVLVGTEAGLFRFAGWLLDTLYSTGATVVAFGTMLGGNYIAEQRERRRLAGELELEREATARLEGEMSAARSIQMGLLPLHFPAFPDRQEIDLFARIEPARDVGGDLFDFLLIDRDRLFFMIGDVSGKGIPAALFMATTKEVVRDAAVRHGAALDRVLGEANAKIAQASNNMAEEGAKLMFVTAFAGLLNLASGDLVYASAGHDSPLVIMAGKELRELTTEGGPPLGAVEDFRYPLSQDRLETGAVLLLYTDGVTEAQNVDGTLFGSRRLNACLTETQASGARGVTDLVFEHLQQFVGTAAQFDDITVLALRRTGAAL